MVLLSIGDVLRELRIRRGYTQEELCFGICSRGNLSKIENGKRMPRWYTIEALFHRIGETADLYINALGKDECRLYQIYKRMENEIINERMIEQEAMQFVLNLDDNSLLMSQYKKFIFILSKQCESEKTTQLITEYVNIIKMTIPHFHINEINKCQLLSYTEFFLLYQIGISLYEINKKEDGWLYLIWLKEYIEAKIVDMGEKAKLYPMILCKLSFWALEESLYEKSREISSMGIRYCIQYDRLNFLSKLLYLKGSSCKAMKQNVMASRYFVQARTISEIMHYYKKQEIIMKDVNSFHHKTYLL